MFVPLFVSLILSLEIIFRMDFAYHPITSVHKIGSMRTWMDRDLFLQPTSRVCKRYGSCGRLAPIHFSRCTAFLNGANTESPSTL